MEVILKELDSFYQFEKDIENVAVVDFLLPNKICIFCDGRYWHGQEKDKKRDGIVTEYLTKCDYVVLRFTDDEINNRASEVKEKIKCAINKV